MAQIKKSVSVLNGSQNVTIPGADLTQRIKRHHIFMVEGSLVPYTVAVDPTFDGTNTLVTLTGAYQGDTNPAAAGVFAVDATYPDMIPTIAQGDVGTASIFTAAMYRLQNMIGAVNPEGFSVYADYYNQVMASHAAVSASEANVVQLEADAQASADAALMYKNAAYDSGAAAAASAAAAGASESAAAASAASALESKNVASGAANTAVNAQVEADASEAAAKNSETNAASSANYAAASKTAAGISETNAAASAASATASKNAASQSEINAKASETAAKTSETNAAASEASALASKNTAVSAEQVAVASKNAAAASEAAALSAKNAAETAATSASTSATTALDADARAQDAKTFAEAAAADAEFSMTTAGQSMDAAIAAKGQAETSAANAATSASEAASSASQTAAHLAAFREVFLGQFATAPTLDPNGNPIKEGAQYFNTTDNLIYEFIGGAWVRSDDETQVSSQNAALSASNAASSASAAATSATNAANSATAASNSAAAAASSESAAAGSASTATTKAGEALNSAANSQASADAAAASAAQAAESAAIVQEGQVNADWAVTDPADKAHILNKPNMAQVFKMPDTGPDTGWIKIGTFTADQLGRVLVMRIHSHAGYNAILAQSQETHLFFKTGNGADVDAYGFAGDAFFYSLGTDLDTTAPFEIKLVANQPGVAATSFDVWMLHGQYSHGSHYEVVVGPDTTWQHAPAVGLPSPGARSASILDASPVVPDISGMRLLHSGNANAYSPSHAGAGAFGTWGIDITGTAKGINNSGDVTLATNGGGDANSVVISERGAHPANTITKALDFNWYGNKWSLGNVRGDSENSRGLGIEFNGEIRARFEGTALIMDNPVPQFILKDRDGTGNAQLGWVSYQDANGAENAYVGYGSVNDQHFYINNNVGDVRLMGQGFKFNGSQVLTADSFKSIIEMESSTIANGTDLDYVTRSGFYRVGDSGANRPGGYGQLLTIHGGGDTITQIYGSHNTGSLSTRSGNPSQVGGGGSWQPWRKVLDEVNFDSLIRSREIQSQRDFIYGTLVKTDISYAASEGDSFLVEITGNSYGGAVPFDVKFQGYIYAGSMINVGGISNGKEIPGIVAMNVGGQLCFWWPRWNYWEGFSVFVSSTMPYAKKYNRAYEIVDVAKPADGTKEVNIGASIKQSITTGNASTYGLSIFNNDQGFIKAPGGYAISLADGYDLNALISTGFYRGLSFANAPLGGWCFVTVVAHNIGWCVQTLVTFGAANEAGLIYQRSFVDSVWTAWKRVWTASDFVPDTDYNSNTIVKRTANGSIVAFEGAFNGSVNLYEGASINLRPTVGEDIGDIVFFNRDGTEKHRLWDNGGTSLSYRYQGGSAWSLWHSGNLNPTALTVLNSNQLGTIPAAKTMQKRNYCYNNGGPSLNDITQAEYGFAYEGQGNNSGPFMHFGGLGGDADYSCQLSANYGSTMSLKFRTKNDDAGGIWNPWRELWHSGNLAVSVGVVGNTVAMRDANGYLICNYLNVTDDGNPGGGTAGVTAIITKQGDNYYRSTDNKRVKNFLAMGGNEVITSVANKGNDIGVAAHMRWENYGNGHVIIDASSGYAPGGMAINKRDPAAIWTESYPTLMGWNGSQTFGVRVDQSRYSEVAGETSMLRGRGNYVWNNAWGPESYVVGIESSFTSSSEGWPYSYGGLINFRPYNGGGGGALQILTPYGPNNGGEDLMVRIGNNENNQWRAWKKLIDANNIGQYNCNSATYVQGINISYYATGDTIPIRTNAGVIHSSKFEGWGFTSHTGDNFSWNGWTTHHYGLTIAQYNSGQYAVLSGYSGIALCTSGAQRLYIADSGWVQVFGDFVANGNITAYSDERLKTNWRPVTNGFVAKWAAVKSGIYDRTDINATQAGLSAQAVREVLPEVVQEGERLSLNYGAAAAVATVELAKEVVTLKQKLADQDALIATLMKRLDALESK